MHPALKSVLVTGCIAIVFQTALCTVLLGLDLPIVAVALCFILGVPLGIAVGLPRPASLFPSWAFSPCAGQRRR